MLVKVVTFPSPRLQTGLDYSQVLDYRGTGLSSFRIIDRLLFECDKRAADAASDR